jgi:hypothetical protein
LGQSKDASYIIIIGRLLLFGEVSDDVAAGGVTFGLETGIEIKAFKKTRRRTKT